MLLRCMLQIDAGGEFTCAVLGRVAKYGSAELAAKLLGKAEQVWRRCAVNPPCCAPAHCGRCLCDASCRSVRLLAVAVQQSHGTSGVPD